MNSKLEFVRVARRHRSRRAKQMRARDSVDKCCEQASSGTLTGCFSSKSHAFCLLVAILIAVFVMSNEYNDLGDIWTEERLRALTHSELFALAYEHEIGDRCSVSELLIFLSLLPSAILLLGTKNMRAQLLPLLRGKPANIPNVHEANEKKHLFKRVSEKNLRASYVKNCIGKGINKIKVIKVIATELHATRNF